MISCVTLISFSGGHVIKRSAGDLEKISTATKEYIANLREKFNQFKGEIESLIKNDLKSSDADRKTTAQQLRSVVNVFEWTTMTVIGRIESDYKKSFERISVCHATILKVKAASETGLAELTALGDDPASSLADVKKKYDAYEKLLKKFEAETDEKCAEEDLSETTKLLEDHTKEIATFAGAIDEFKLYKEDLVKITAKYSKSVKDLSVDYQRKVEELKGNILNMLQIEVQ